MCVFWLESIQMKYIYILASDIECWQLQSVSAAWTGIIQCTPQCSLLIITLCTNNIIRLQHVSALALVL